MDSNSLSDNPLFVYLLEEGLLSDLEVRDLARKAGTDCMPLGQILVRHKIISIQDLMKALTFQDDDPNARVGELCVTHGFCNQAQIDAALQLQSRSAPDSLLLVLNEFGTSNGDLLRGVAKYVSSLERGAASDAVEIDELTAQIADYQQILEERGAA